jgi:hypothetical protein
MPAQHAALSSAEGAPGLLRKSGGGDEQGAGAGERQQQDREAEQQMGVECPPVVCAAIGIVLFSGGFAVERRRKPSQALALRSRIVLQCAGAARTRTSRRRAGCLRRRWGSGAGGFASCGWTGPWVRGQAR